MTDERKVIHMERMLEHARRETERAKQENAEFERGCRAFWDFMRRAESAWYRDNLTASFYAEQRRQSLEYLAQHPNEKPF